MQIKIINRSAHALPHYETEASAGMDLRANILEPITLKPLERAIVKTGLFIELPVGLKRRCAHEADWRLKKGLPF